MDFLTLLVVFLVSSAVLYLVDPAVGLGLFSFFVAVAVSDIVSMLFKSSLIFITLLFFLHVYLFGNYDHHMYIMDWITEHCVQHPRVRRLLQWNIVVYFIAVLQWMIGVATGWMNTYGYYRHVERVAYFLYKEPYIMQRRQRIQQIKKQIKQHSRNLEYQEMRQLQQHQENPKEDAATPRHIHDKAYSDPGIYNNIPTIHHDLDNSVIHYSHQPTIVMAAESPHHQEASETTTSIIVVPPSDDNNTSRKSLRRALSAIQDNEDSFTVSNSVLLMATHPMGTATVLAPSSHHNE